MIAERIRMLPERVYFYGNGIPIEGVLLGVGHGQRTHARQRASDVTPRDRDIVQQYRLPARRGLG